MKIDTALGSLRRDAAKLSSDATPLRAPARMWPRRAAFWAPIVALTGLGVALGGAATAGVASPLRWPLLALLAVNLCYMALTGCRRCWALCCT